VLAFSVDRRRLGPSERATVLVLFERPPYKLSNEMLLLQWQSRGLCDRPAWRLLGSGCSSSPEDQNGRENEKKTIARQQPAGSQKSRLIDEVKRFLSSGVA